MCPLCIPGVRLQDDSMSGITGMTCSQVVEEQSRLTNGRGMSFAHSLSPSM